MNIEDFNIGDEIARVDVRVRGVRDTTTGEETFYVVIFVNEQYYDACPFDTKEEAQAGFEDLTKQIQQFAIQKH